MSHVAIAAALALPEVSTGHRLAAFSLASFANREHRAWPGTRIAAARAGLSRSQYLAARGELSRRGLLMLESPGGGRGNSPLVALRFAESGPWVEETVNAPLFEAVLSYTHTRGSARLLLAALAALADGDLRVCGFSTADLRAGAGVADSTYRRARMTLLASGELNVEPGGGRSRTNCWQLLDPRTGDASPAMAQRRRVAPPSGARPLLATVAPEPVADGNTGEGDGVYEVVMGSGPALGSPGQSGKDSTVKSPGLSATSTGITVRSQTVLAAKGPELSGVSVRNPAQARTVAPKTPSQTPSQTPSETPPPYARAGRESQNQRTRPPDPPEGGQPGCVAIVEHFDSDRGRRRQRTVTVSPAELSPISDHDRDVWRDARERLCSAVGSTMFEIWLADYELIAVATTDRALLIAGRPESRSWVASRYRLVFAHLSERLGRPVRVADARELAIHRALNDARHDVSVHLVRHDHQEAV